ncbi:hypothetical protein PINS_up014551, partial [Pythium insidiosum]
MYPNFKSLSDKERKRQELLRQIEEDLRIERLKEQAYSEALWASDFDNNKINLKKAGTSAGTQTDDMDELNSGAQVGKTSKVSKKIKTGEIGTQADFEFKPSESDLMREEDLLSDIQRHQDKIFDNKNTINRQAYIIQELMNSNEKMHTRFQVAESQFNALLRDNELSKREINALRNDFELGRQIYLALQQKAQSIEGERNVAIDELENLKQMYKQGEE